MYTGPGVPEGTLKGLSISGTTKKRLLVRETAPRKVVACRKLWKSHGFGCVSKSLSMETPSLLPPLDAAVAAGDIGKGIGKGPKPDSGLRIRVFYTTIESSSVREDGLRLSPSGTYLKPSSQSHASGGTSPQIKSVTARALREVPPFRDVGPSCIVTNDISWWPGQDFGCG